MIPTTHTKASRSALHATLGIAFTLCTLTATQGFAQSPAPAGDMSKMPMQGAHSMMQPNDMSRSMTKMQEKMSGMSMTGNQDVDFAMMMKVHHEGAIEMSQAELDNGKDPMMRAAAKKIISAQKKEIAEFDRWMSKHPAMKSDAMAK